MAVILLAFSSVLIYTVELKVRHGFKDRITIVETEGDPIQNTSDDIEMLIYFVDGFLLLGIGFASYFLAGKTLKPIKEALDAQKKFSADASHDLRTPLAMIITESEVTLQSKKSTEGEFKKTVESNLEEAKKMSKLVNELLLISRGDNQATRYSFTEIDLHNFIERMISKVKYQAENKGLKIKLCEYKKVLIPVDKDNFERAISNIIQNAIKYTNQGTITIDAREENKKVTITISDTGVGIDQKDLPYIFDRFYKAEHSRNDNSSSGLGLSIAKLIIEEHKGSIGIESEVNRGTVAIITMSTK
jgi:signal transduction histidine kinase